MPQKDRVTLEKHINVVLMCVLYIADVDPHMKDRIPSPPRACEDSGCDSVGHPSKLLAGNQEETLLDKAITRDEMGYTTVQGVSEMEVNEFILSRRKPDAGLKLAKTSSKIQALHQHVRRIYM